MATTKEEISKTNISIHEDKKMSGRSDILRRSMRPMKFRFKKQAPGRASAISHGEKTLIKEIKEEPADEMPSAELDAALGLIRFTEQLKPNVIPDESKSVACSLQKSPPFQTRKEENEFRWMERYDELKAYRALHGDANVPKDYSGNPRLGRWVQNQRMQYKKMIKQEASGLATGKDGKKERMSCMTHGQVELLNQVGFQFKLRDEWIDRYRELERYFHQHGNCLIPRRYVANPSLGHFVAKQRFQMKLFRERKPCSMTIERIRLLEKINFDWNVLEAAWMEHYKELIKFYKQYGNCLVPESWDDNPSLGLWVGNQRSQYKRFKEKKPSKITSNRIHLLEQLDFEWSALEARWMYKYVELGNYIRDNGIGSLPPKNGPSKELRRWTDTQRLRYDDMPSRRRDLMKLLGFTQMNEEEAREHEYEEFKELEDKLEEDVETKAVKVGK